MEDKIPLRWMLVTAIAPIAWGSVYVVTRNLLPGDVPLWGAVYRAVPAALILLLVTRRLPRGIWWWRSILLGVLNVGGFFVLIYVAGTRLPSSVAATLMSASAAVMLLFGWAFLKQRPRLMAVAGAAIGIVGVLVMLGVSAERVDPWGVAASLAAMLSSSLGFVLTARWSGEVPPVTMAAWQLGAGGVLLLPIAAIVEGAPPIPVGGELLGFVYITVIATALGYTAWFTGLKHLRASAVGTIGLLNPVTGVVLGVLLAGEAFGPLQLLGLLLVIAGVIVANLPSRAPRSRLPVVDLSAGGRRS
ncbi:DMT family transporter [Microbacterium gorillae]|uniref:DMT family transporter n=1 Tax=Microbacterium gorillae TaxID=1231063 RepID=UPI00069365F4|nr:EamA family transporter [Microbacterium gorillae]